MPLTEIKTQLPNEDGIPFKPLECESKILNTSGNGLTIATVLLPMANNAVLKFSKKTACSSVTKGSRLAVIDRAPESHCIVNNIFCYQ